MKLQSKYADLVLNLLVAVAISLVVNFSYVLLMLVDLNSDSQPRPSDQRAVERPDEGVLSVHPDGYGYLVYENGDSVYVPTRRMRWLEIAPGDRIVADLLPPGVGQKPVEHSCLAGVFAHAHDGHTLHLPQLPDQFCCCHILSPSGEKCRSIYKYTANKRKKKGGSSKAR